MEIAFKITRSSRNVLFSILDGLTIEELNETPSAFNNNIIWNIGHIIVVQQLLVYNLSGLPMMISKELISKYKKGSKPESLITKEEILELKKLLFSTLDQTELDRKNNIFKEYNSFTTMSGFTIVNAESAIQFNNYHEAIHTGIIMQLKKFI